MCSMMQKNGRTTRGSVAPTLVPLWVRWSRETQNDASKNERGLAHEQVAEHCVVWQHGHQHPNHCGWVPPCCDQRAHQTGGPVATSGLINRSPSRPAPEQNCSGDKRPVLWCPQNPKAPRIRPTVSKLLYRQHEPLVEGQCRGCCESATGHHPQPKRTAGGHKATSQWGWILKWEHHFINYRSFFGQNRPKPDRH